MQRLLTIFFMAAFGAVVTQANAGDALYVASRVEPQKDGTRLISVSARILIDAPPSAVWEEMTDCAGAATIVPGLKTCEILTADPVAGRDIRRHVIDYGLLLPATTNEFLSIYDAPRRIAFSRTGGDLSVMEGEWRLRSIEGRATELHYSARLGLGVPLPKGLMRRLIGRETATILRNLKSQAEARAQ